MSFVFEWDKLDDEVALQIEGMIHAHFQRIPKPTFMGNIAVSKFRFGSTPPNITVLDVTDPLEEWYVHMDQEEARLAQEAAEGGGGESMDEDELASGEEYDNDEYSYSGDGSIVMVGEGDDIEYLRSGSYEEDEQLETEKWMPRHHHRPQRQEGSGSDYEYYTSTRDHSQHFKSALASPTRISPSSSASSSGSGQSRCPSSAHDHLPQAGNRYYGDNKESNAASTAFNRGNRNPKLGIDTSLSSPARARSFSSTQHNPISTKKPTTTHSLSSHASDEEIESEAFYTQGESTIYQRMKNLVLEPSSFLSSRPASVEGESSDDQPQPKSSSTTQQTTFGAPLLPTTPGGPNGNANNGLAFGFNAGMGSSPGSVLSSVMQTRSNTRPLSAASFYSTPPAAATAAGAATSHPTTTQHPQLYFPDLSGMVVSGNSLLGLRAGTPSRTIPSTPRGFESPTLAFSRRQSFSDNGSDDPAANSSSNRYSAPVPIPSQNGLDHHQQTTEYMSPVEALSFDAFSRQPKVVERLKDEENVHPAHSQSAQSYNGNHQSQQQASPRSRPDRGRQQRQADVRRRRKQNQDDGYRRAGPGNQPSFPPSPIPMSKRHENDIQMLLAVQYQGQMGFTVETELLLNYPTYAFLTLPVKLIITGFSFKTKMLMGYLRDHVNVTFLEPEDPNESILSNVRIESQVGEQKQAVLKNVGKIERFVVDQLRKFITEDFVYPSYHSIELMRAPAPAPPLPPPPPTTTTTAQPVANVAAGSATLTTAGSAGRDRSSSSRGVSPAASTTAESVNHEPYRLGEMERGVGGQRGGRQVGSRGSAGSTTTTASLIEASTYSRH
ncbi:Mitochondrial distribution and morphology protein 12 [Haplosporangium gracile]|nr:Mitochondrial distribution and morphology protein 12 [Haplosporangium gracile]